MQIILHIDTKKIDTDYEHAINEYFKRTSAFANISMKLYKDFMKLSLKDNSFKFVVVSGKASFTSTEFAKKITNIGLNGYSCIEFIISEINLYEDIYTDKNNTKDKPLDLSDENYEIFNLTSMNIGVEPTATALAEQIYRAYTINNNINYHK
ncbi:MAG: 23S rRNA (pseudouridine(1915)-N(3))-methyltransferase RlmH [Lachnospiraceae bacterium]|nr:23S rRNA (pseudouridine(1915)-N(3))-methyltransferase RlmH [Lachnospiraceae bacterium]